MAECLICTNSIERGKEIRAIADRFSGNVFSVCPQCRADLDLGRMVRKMKDGSRLDAPNPYSAIKQWRYSELEKGYTAGDTPEAALKAAKGE